MDHPTPSTKRRSNSVLLSRGRSAPALVAKPAPLAAPSFSRPVAESVRVLVRMCLVLFLGMVSFAVDGPVSWWGFEELTLAIGHATGQGWNAPPDTKWMIWIFVTVVSTLSLAHFTLNWREYGRGWQGLAKGFLFVTLVLVPSQLWDFVDSTAGLYGLFQPVDLSRINVPLLYISIAGAIFGSFIAPTFALLLAREGTPEGNMPHAAKGSTHDHP
jgi:hypothetical protein